MILYGASYVNDIIDDTQQHPTAYSIQYDITSTSNFFILHFTAVYIFLLFNTYNVQRTTYNSTTYYSTYMI
jgi:hypothetical protein